MPEPQLELLCIRKNCSKLSAKIPNRIFINGRFVGILKQKEACIRIPQGDYSITVQSPIPFFYANEMVNVGKGLKNLVVIESREKVWDIIFCIDLVLCIAKFFFSLPSPWDTIYEISTNLFFVLWLCYEFYIHKKYYR
ncbi:MAG: hypothetical protein HUK15_08545, partial [Bacteroidales bacterium]|nr:hypothetical protein [Bacteroidales bacterium]